MPLSLSGRIPASLGLLPDLVALTLSWNKLTGPIPESLGYFKKPIVLELDNNLLTGSVPQSMVRANMWFGLICVLLVRFPLVENYFMKKWPLSSITNTEVLMSKY